jgi:hypothetical protein
MKRSLHLLWIIPVLVATFWIALPTTTDARPANEVETYYFSDASKTVEVGYRWLDCYGHIYKWGTTSRFFDRFQYPCY